MANPLITITELQVLSPEDHQAYCELLPQLSNHVKVPTEQALAEVLRLPHIHVLIAKTDRIVGALTLVINQLSTGINVRIEDVVVDKAARGQGLGKKLMSAAIEKATAAGATAINLTSHPSRVAANQLYRSLGFQPRETNVYRYTIT